MIITSIVTYKTDIQELSNLLKCIYDSCISKVYVIDNSPSDDIGKWIEQNANEKVEYIFGHGNIGYGAAHNIAIRKSIELEASYHLVVNSDVYFNSDIIEDIQKYMDNNIDVGQLMPKVIYPNGELQYLCKMIPTPFDSIAKRFLPKKIMNKRLEKFQLKFTDYNEIMNIPILSGCFMFFRISALKKMGLFDERFFMYGEDFDISRRMHQHFKTIFYPKVTIVHAHAAEHRTSKKMLWIHIFNMIKYFNKWGWFFDAERKKINKKLLQELGYKNNAK